MNQSPNCLDLSVFENAPIAMAIIGSVTGTIHAVNGAYCSLLGREREQLVGSNWMRYTHPGDVANDVISVLDLRRKEKSSGVREKRYIRKDGSIVYARVTLCIQEDDADGQTHMVMIEDLTRLYVLSARMRDCFTVIHSNSDSVFNSLAVVAQFRDRETGEHLKRTEQYMRLILENLPDPQPYSAYGIHKIAHASILHDIGKVGIPDSILLKAGRLTEDEFKIMETHTTLGVQAIQETMRYIQNDTALEFAREIAKSHHERWDGSGYPNKLKEEEIPLSARIMALADVYDALRSKRVYKDSFSHEKAVQIITDESGTHFDPGLVDVFLKQEKRFAEIADTEPDELLPADDDMKFSEPPASRMKIQMPLY